MKLRGSQTDRERLGDAPASRIGKLTTLQIERMPTFGPNCPKCSAVTVQRDGKFGSFWGCRNYPKCKGTVQMQRG